MRKFILCGVFLCLTFFSVFAQISVASMIGVNMGNTHFSKVSNQTSVLPQVMGGIQVAYNLNEKWSLGTGVQYSAKGYKSQGMATSAAKYTYLDFLPTAEYKLNSFLSVYGGANVGAKLNEKYKNLGEWTNPVEGITSKLDIGALLGVKCSYKNLFLAAHFNQSVLPITKLFYSDESGQITSNVGQYNQNLQLAFGYKINLSK